MEGRWVLELEGGIRAPLCLGSGFVWMIWPVTSHRKLFPESENIFHDDIFSVRLGILFFCWESWWWDFSARGRVLWFKKAGKNVSEFGFDDTLGQLGSFRLRSTWV
jgi:hypothetical protein